MPKAGGSSTITGVDFEAWFVALKFADAFFDESMRVTPQAKTYIDPKTHQTEITSIDDVHITSRSKHEFYNLKFRAPNIVSWNLKDLKHYKVLSQLKDQFLKTPDATLYFVSQSDCTIFREILPRGAACSSKETLEIELAPNDYIKIWNAIQKELNFLDQELIRFSNQVKYIHIINIEEIERLILQKLTGHITNVRFAPAILHKLALEAGKLGKSIDKDSVIKYLVEHDIQLDAHHVSHYYSPSIEYSNQINIDPSTLNILQATVQKLIAKNEIGTAIEELREYLVNTDIPDLQIEVRDLSIRYYKFQEEKELILQNILSLLQEITNRMIRVSLLPISLKMSDISLKENFYISHERQLRVYSGKVKFQVCRRLTHDWLDLADYLDIPLSVRKRFEPGREPQGVWEWLEERDRLNELPEALVGIDRHDLIKYFENQ